MMGWDTRAEKATFALIVVNYGSSHLLEANLSSLDAAALNGRIIVVDNHTNATERENVRRLADSRGWILLTLDSNIGFGPAVNAGASVAICNGASVLVVLNPDARIEAADLMRMVGAATDDPALLVSPIIKTSSGTVWFDGMKLYSATGRVASSRRRVLPRGSGEPWISGACFATSAVLWERVGGFDEDYFLYWEDVDLSRRVARAGGRLAVLEAASAVHDPGGTQTGVGGPGTKSESYYFYNIRNRLVFAAKHLEGNQLLGWLLATPRVSYEIMCTGGRRQILASPVPLRAYFRGIINGLRMLLVIRWRTKRPPRPETGSLQASRLTQTTQNANHATRDR